MTLAEMLASMSHADLMRLRKQPGADQALLGPYEHRAFAREWTQESPLAASLSLPFAIPLYTAYKALGRGNTRSPASLDEIKQGYLGLLEGWTQ
jgi:predicted membrane-bound mannosyltransferase